MAFASDEIENGTGKPGAIVYGRTSDPVAEAISYLVRRGKTSFANLTGDLNGVSKQEISLLRGTEHVERVARPLLQGSIYAWKQRLLFPRIGIIVAGLSLSPLSWEISFPDGYLEACWEAAELHASGEPLGDVVETDTKVKKERLGGSATSGLETEYFYPGKSKLHSYPVVMDLIRPYCRPVGELARA